MEKREQTLVHYWWEGRLVQPLWKPVGSSNIKNGTTIYDLATLLLGIFPKEMKSGSPREIHNSVFIATFIHLKYIQILFFKYTLINLRGWG